jgi:hypothetical protein
MVLLQPIFVLIELNFVVVEGLLSLLELFVHFIFSLLEHALLEIKFIGFFEGLFFQLLLAITQSDELVIVETFSSSILIICDD